VSKLPALPTPTTKKTVDFEETDGKWFEEQMHSPISTLYSKNDMLIRMSGEDQGILDEEEIKE